MKKLMFTRNLDRPLWLAGTYAPIHDNHKTIIGVVCNFTDITDRKHKTEAILASERELLQVTLNSLGEGVVAANRQGQVIFINEAATNLTGYSRAEADGNRSIKFFMFSMIRQVNRLILVFSVKKFTIRYSSPKV